MPEEFQFDRAKLRAAILHTCNAVDPAQLGAVKLHKVLYFADMIRFAETGAPLTGAVYRKRPFGPTCVQLLPTLNVMVSAGEIEVRDVEFYGRVKKEYVARIAEPKGVLNAAEIALLDEVIEFVCNQHSARSISEYSHQLPWEIAEFGEVIPYRTALMLFPAELTPEAFEAVETGAREVEEARLRADTVGFPLLSDFRSRLQSALRH